MPTDNLTDADVLAELREGVPGVDEDGIERYAWTHPEGISPVGVRVLVRLIAHARREAREAAAVERAACLREVTDYHDALLHERNKLVLLPVAARIRARGQS